MHTPASVARHPIHPMLVPIPIGLWLFSLFCDLVHRFGAATAGIGLLVAALVCLRKSRRHVARIAAACVLAALVLQLTIGVTMVLRGFPLWLATAHNGGAALLLLATLALVWSLSGRSSVLVPSLHT